MLYHNTNVILVVVFISFGGKGGVQTVIAFLVQMRDFFSSFCASLDSNLARLIKLSIFFSVT